ncbi:odv-e27 [Clostera anastomosis granulovirus A]|uniref:Odv-e27 n=1 Tax=Clostera anastomosis granulovirus A TaxID=1986289 RepID=U5KBM3_9BBAC|nr:odv-e27 [Clostera anastomosis granulovirus Henan]AGQ20343.1 odv-e27 [Clostera anastomosis granulovirus Henan]
MDRSRSDEKKVDNYRTVTEIVDADNVYQKDFDVTDLVHKNVSYLNKKSKRELYLMVAKYYVEVVRELSVPDMRTLFSSSSMSDNMFSFVYYSLAFVYNQLLPHNMQFIDMKFFRVAERKMSVPTDPIVFYKSLDSDDSTITCYVDAANILRILEKPFDVDVKFETDDDKNEMFKMIDRIKMVEQKQNQQSCVNRIMFVDNQPAPNINETYVTPLVTLLILFSNAALDLFKLMRSDFQQYYHYLLNHEALVKERSIPNVTNLITGHFTFTVSGEVDKNRKSGLVFKK